MDVFLGNKSRNISVMLNGVCDTLELKLYHAMFFVFTTFSTIFFLRSVYAMFPYSILHWSPASGEYICDVSL